MVIAVDFVAIAPFRRANSRPRSVTVAPAGQSGEALLARASRRGCRCCHVTRRLAGPGLAGPAVALLRMPRRLGHRLPPGDISFVCFSSCLASAPFRLWEVPEVRGVSDGNDCDPDDAIASGVMIVSVIPDNGNVNDSDNQITRLNVTLTVMIMKVSFGHCYERPEWKKKSREERGRPLARKGRRRTRRPGPADLSSSVDGPPFGPRDSALLSCSLELRGRGSGSSLILVFLLVLVLGLVLQLLQLLLLKLLLQLSLLLVSIPPPLLSQLLLL